MKTSHDDFVLNQSAHSSCRSCLQKLYGVDIQLYANASSSFMSDHSPQHICLKWQIIGKRFYKSQFFIISKSPIGSNTTKKLRNRTKWFSKDPLFFGSLFFENRRVLSFRLTYDSHVGQSRYVCRSVSSRSL